MLIDFELKRVILSVLKFKSIHLVQKLIYVEHIRRLPTANRVTFNLAEMIALEG